MTELQFALENGVQVEVKELNENEIMVSWNNGSNVEVISKEEAVELGLVKEEVKTTEAIFFLNSKEYTSMDEITFIEEANKLAESLHGAKRRVKYGVKFENKDALLAFTGDNWNFFSSNINSFAENGKVKWKVEFFTTVSNGVFTNNHVNKRLSTTIKHFNK